MYDQYRKPVKDSEKGGAKVMIKENFGAHSSPFLRIRSALNKWIAIYEAKDWHPPRTDAAFGDAVNLENIAEEDFRIDRTGEFVPGIKNGRQVFSVSNHKWWGSINETNVVPLSDNNWSGKVVNVEKKKLAPLTTNRKSLRISKLRQHILLKQSITGDIMKAKFFCVYFFIAHAFFTVIAADDSSDRKSELDSGDIKKSIETLESEIPNNI